MSKIADWSRAVRERDGRCLDCGATEDLHAHHVLPKSTHPELALDLSNGKTLCYRCHKRAHEGVRPIRTRHGRPQRKTLERRVAQLEAENRVLRERLGAVNAWLGSAPDATLPTAAPTDAITRARWRVRKRLQRAKKKGAEAPLGE